MQPNETAFSKRANLKLFARVQNGSATLERLDTTSGGSLARVIVGSSWAEASASMADGSDYLLINSGNKRMELVEIADSANIDDTTSRNILRPYGSDGRV